MKCRRTPREQQAPRGFHCLRVSIFRSEPHSASRFAVRNGRLTGASTGAADDHSAVGRAPPGAASELRGIARTALLLTLAGCTVAGNAPDPNLRPTYGTVHLDAGFRNDPWQLRIEAGGDIDARAVAPGCAGFVAGAPDIDLAYRAGAYSLYIFAISEADTTLVVNAPDGSWHCSDDALALGPLVTFESPAAGFYNIWVGSVSDRLEQAELLVSEVDPAASDGPVPSASGSGFFVSDDGYLVTNAHVVDDCDSYAVVDHGTAELVAKDDRADLALLKIGGYRGSHAAFATGDVRLGDDVLLLGYPLADILGSLNVTTGVVSGLAGLERDADVFQFSAPLQSGNSGGPVLDQSGRVIGVATYSLDEWAELDRTGSLPQNINFAIRTDVIVRFLERSGVTAARADGGAALARRDIAAQGSTFTVQVRCLS